MTDKELCAQVGHLFVKLEKNCLRCDEPKDLAERGLRLLIQGGVLAQQRQQEGVFDSISSSGFFTYRQLTPPPVRRWWEFWK